jgi:hypothetical protein
VVPTVEVLDTQVNGELDTGRSRSTLKDEQMETDRQLDQSSTRVEQTTENSVKSHLPAEYNLTVVKITLYIIFFANLFLNIDMGILPAGS